MNKVYAFSDLHGQYNLWKQISDYCDETDKIYFLGDAIDRGSDNVKIMQELLSDPRVIYLKGNHEQLLINAANYILGEDLDDYDFNLWISNGGIKTYEELFLDKPIEISKGYVHHLKRLPIIKIYINKNNQKIILTHAGFNPDALVDILWNRQHLIQTIWHGLANEFIVHGHTPVQHLKRNNPGLIENYTRERITNQTDAQVAFYCERHKIDIDLGCFATNKIALLDLDTFEPIYFQG